MPTCTYADKVGQLCPRCQARTISKSSAERSEEFKAKDAYCDFCLAELLRIALRGKLNEKPVKRVEIAPSTPRVHQNEKVKEDEVKIASLMEAFGLSPYTIKVLSDAGIITVRSLNDAHRTRVVHKVDILLLDKLLQTNSAVLAIIPGRIRDQLFEAKDRIQELIEQGALS